MDAINKVIRLITLVIVFNVGMLSAETDKGSPLLGDNIQRLIYYIGSPDAPITFVEFYSASCPWTKRFRLEVFDRVKEKYIDSGDVLFISIPFVHHDEDMVVAKYAQCTSDEHFWSFQKALFESSEQWTRKTKSGKITAPADIAYVTDLVTRFGVEKKQAKQCLEDKGLHEDLILTRILSTEEFGVINTPHYEIDGKSYHELSWADVDWLLGSLLKDKGER